MFLVDWTIKMRIRPPEFETSICDAKNRVSLSTRSVLGKCVYLVTLAMSLFDLQDVCMAIGSIATLDLPMVVDLIGIYGLKGPYRMPTTTDWFLQALSVIPRGSWGDFARRFTMIRWAVLAAPSLLSKRRRRRPPCAAAAAARCRRKFVSGQLDEENPFVQNSSVLLVQPDEGVSVLVVDRIGDYLPTGPDIDTLYQQDQAFRSLIQSVLQENHNDTDVLSLALKAIRAQNAILSTDLADVRKEAKEQKAIIEDMDERLATVRSELLDFHIARSVRLSGEVTRVSQRFGMLTIDSADAFVKRDQQRRNT
ncbi:centromere-associated protein E [Dorcoceras hygrometricum]|uniref:Centromere-associated protein E n=1 Tax=Dorcoceras hygrometricum TaxID=472368 RepID=A0A2Z7DK85_9LAMI|nr:centromere-associated protein E [Dorcoceras hygrometricum]